jgi:hypothetical protein
MRASPTPPTAGSLLHCRFGSTLTVILLENLSIEPSWTEPFQKKAHPSLKVLFSLAFLHRGGASTYIIGSICLLTNRELRLARRVVIQGMGMQEWMEKIDWDSVYKSVLVAAYRMSANRPNRKQYAENLAHEAIARSLTTRTIDLTKYDYFVYVLGIMRSIRSDELRSPGAKLFVSDDATIVRFPDRPTQEDALSDAQILRYIERRSAEAHRVATLMLSGFKTSPEIAQAMGCSPQRVDYLKRQLRAIALELIDEEPNAGGLPALSTLSKISGTE